LEALPGGRDLDAHTAGVKDWRETLEVFHDPW
jgi:hypothetical protein